MPELGDQPIEPLYRQMMNDLAMAIDSFFNGDTKGTDRKTGFILLVFKYNEKEGRCNYISNGANRDDVLKLLEEQVKRFKELQE